MNVRLLLDENLSERLLPLLSDRFPDSSKDEDFLRLSVTCGFPPKVICLAIGNAGNAATAALLLDHTKAIEAFSTHPEAGFLLLKPGGQAP
ncbi:MAG: DUF5615 family PIN-like protein [Synechococcaceae cyanobacterium]